MGFVRESVLEGPEKPRGSAIDLPPLWESDLELDAVKGTEVAMRIVLEKRLFLVMRK